jgi:transposase
MKIIKTIGLDMAKQVFQVHGADKSGRSVLRRGEVACFFSEVPLCLVGIKGNGKCALRSAGDWWAWAYGPADDPAVRNAICRVAEERRQRCRGDLRGGNQTSDAFRSPESIEQQDLQCLHRVRSRLVACRT